MARVNRSRKSTINRIRYYNRLVPKERRVRISKNLTVGELRQRERDVKTNVYFQRLDFDIEAKNVSQTNVKRFEKLSRAYARQDTKQFENLSKQLFRGNQKRFEEIEKDFEKVKDISRIEFKLEVLNQLPQNIRDVEILAEAIANESFSTKTILEELSRLNENENIKELGGIDIDNFDLLDEKARQFMKNLQESPDILDDIGQDEFEII